MGTMKRMTVAHIPPDKNTMNKAIRTKKRIIGFRFERQYKSLHVIGIHFQKVEALVPEMRKVRPPNYVLVIDLWSHRLQLKTRKKNNNE